MTRVSGRERGAGGRLATLELVGACLIILVLAQALIGLLSLAAYSRLATTATAERVELLTRNTAAAIEAGLRLGKPLAQFSGLQRVLERSVGDQPDVLHAEVTLPDGFVLAALGPAAPSDTDLVAVTAAPALTPTPNAGLRRLNDGAVLYDGDALLAVAVPLHAGTGPAHGVLSVWVDDGAQAAREAAFLKRSLGVLAMTTGAAVLVLALVFGLVGVAAPAAGVLTGWRLALPLAAMLLAQGVYALDATTSFRAAWLQATRDNVQMLAERTQRDLERVLDMNVDLSRVRGVDAMFARLVRELPAVQSLRLTDTQGRTIAAADSSGPVPRVADASPPAADDMRIVLPLSRAADAAREAAGSLDIRLDPAVIAAGVRARVLDAGTVALISAITAFEMFLLLAVVMTRTRGTQAPTTVLVPGGPVARAERVARIARPVMFGFLFAWALPLSFLPLYAGTLPAQWLSLPRDLLMALPLSAEMLCGLGGALLAGRLTDQRGWRLPVLCGLVLAGTAALLASAVHTLEAFVLARAAVGLGYGLAWMGLQGFVVTRSSPVFRGRNMAWLLAGLFAGHLSGTAVGAMLADQAGYRPVFIASAALLVLPVAGVLWLASRQRHFARVQATIESAPAVPRAPLPAAGRAMVRDGSRSRELVRLLFSRDFGALLAGSVIPFSVAQVGLLYFALPLYLQAQGVAASSIGRVLMLYGLCMIYLGPVIGRVVDRTARKKPLIVLGGLLGSAGMVYLYVDNSLFAVSLAVFLLALGSCWSGAAQTVWMLSLPNVQRYGPGAATSVMRAADKFGQMVGPLFVGFLFTVVGTAQGLAITGVFYLVATLVFVAVAPGRPQRAEA